MKKRFMIILYLGRRSINETGLNIFGEMDRPFTW